MYALTQDFVDACPIEHGFRLRGLEMTRTEVFVDAAFAFALTLLVIGSIRRDVRIRGRVFCSIVFCFCPVQSARRKQT